MRASDPISIRRELTRPGELVPGLAGKPFYTEVNWAAHALYLSTLCTPMHPLEKVFTRPDRPCGTTPETSPARYAYVVLFTPRSGSSLLTELCGRTGVLGYPGEIFRARSMYNPDTGGGNFLKLPSQTIDAYADAARRWFKSEADVFGFQATASQIRPLLDSGSWWRLFPDLRYCMLTRQDIVAQAVSLYLMNISGVAHSSSGNTVSEWDRYSGAQYNASAIYRWIRHVFNMEWLMERHFSNTDALRITYEEFVADKGNILKRLARHVGVELEGLPDMRSTEHQKLGHTRNAEWAARFRSENREVVSVIEADRGQQRIQEIERRLPGGLGGLLPGL